MLLSSPHRLWNKIWSRLELKTLEWCTLREALDDTPLAWSASDLDAHLKAGAIRRRDRGVIHRDILLPPGTPVTVHLRPSSITAVEMRRTGNMVVHRDSSLVILDKPAALPSVAPCDNNWQHLAVEARSGGVVPQGSPLLVTSRLDAGTHGLIVFARKVKAQREFNMSLASGGVTKRYEAVITPKFTSKHHRKIPEEESIVHWLSDPTAISKSEGDRIERCKSRRVTAALIEHDPQRGTVTVAESMSNNCPLRAELVVESIKPLNSLKLAQLSKIRALRCWPTSQLESLSNIERAQLLQIKLLTGRTHQIRAQLSALGWAILGDELYGCNHKEWHHPNKINAWALSCVSLGFDFAGVRYDVELPAASETEDSSELSKGINVTSM